MPKKLTTDEFIKRAKRRHGDKYDYSLVDFNGIYKKVKIICPIHGIFEQIPKSHMKYECKECGHLKTTKKRTSSVKYFISKAKKIHGDKYDYSLVKYKTARINVKIICSTHGIFEQTPSNHTHIIHPAGCTICYGTKKLTTEEFVKKAKEIHGDRYDYSLVNYTNNKTRVKIICKKHGIFTQTPQKHILRNRGCPTCKSSKGELQVSNYLKKHKISYIPQHTFTDCKNILPLHFDFYIPEKNMCIEFDGLQHFKPINYFGGEKEFKLTQKRDKIKTQYCKDNNIELLRIRYDDIIIKKLLNRLI